VTRDRFDPAGGGRRCLLFDLGNVLIDFDHGVVSRTLARHATGDHPAPAEAIHEYIFGGSGAASPNAGIDRGTGSIEALHAEVAARFSLAVSLDEFRRAWSSIFADDLNRAVADRLTQASARFGSARTRTRPTGPGCGRNTRCSTPSMGTSSACCRSGLARSRRIPDSSHTSPR